MRIEVVNTGTELLLGKVVNTHAGYIGQELFKLGLRIQRQTTIPDGDEIRDVLQEAFPRTDVILITGGLGPTSDDITREVVAEMLGRELHLDEEILETINEMFRSRGLKRNASNDRQAMVPDGAIVLENPNGTAPGLYIPEDKEHDAPHLFLLPGPPRELKPMFQNLVYPRLAEMQQEDLESHIWHNFRIYGVGESGLASQLEPKFEPFESLELGYCARLGEVDLRLIGPRQIVEQASEIVRADFKEDIITESEDPIEQVILDLLREQGATVSTAESCTGGLIASTITNVSGSSAIMKVGYVTYANEAKEEILGVPRDLLEAHGAVSEPVVRAMAEGCLRASGADYAVAISGIAGPTGGSEEKPVGTVYIGIAKKNEPTFAKRYFSPADRVSFKMRVTRLALDLLRRRIQGFLLD
ncbi:MAG: competence/damage-inducible protein A [Verrucomicrobiales bacterium]|nr:competence/damage-inducible protein A [Verrucomicrobiales bacterium]